MKCLIWSPWWQPLEYPPPPLRKGKKAVHRSFEFIFKFLLLEICQRFSLKKCKSRLNVQLRTCFQESKESKVVVKNFLNPSFSWCKSNALGKCFNFLTSIHSGTHLGPILSSAWPDWEIYWTLGNFSNPLATIILPKFPTFLGNSCKVIKIFNFSSEIIFGQLFWHLTPFYWSHCSSWL